MVSVGISIRGDLDPHPQPLTVRSAHPHVRRAALLDWLFKVTYNGAEEKVVLGVGRTLCSRCVTGA